MALVRSTLNPNAPLFIPVAVRKVEDFSPEWWQLVTNSSWYCNYWLSLNPDGFDDHADKDLQGDGVVDLLSDNFDIDASEDFSAMEAQYEEFLQLSENGEGKVSPSASNGIIGGTLELFRERRNPITTREFIILDEKC